MKGQIDAFFKNYLLLLSMCGKSGLIDWQGTT